MVGVVVFDVRDDCHAPYMIPVVRLVTAGGIGSTSRVEYSVHAARRTVIADARHACFHAASTSDGLICGTPLPVVWVFGQFQVSVGTPKAPKPGPVDSTLSHPELGPSYL